MRDEFLSVAAHELKTPVTTLLGFAQLLLSQLRQKGVLDDVIVDRALRAVEQGSKRMSRLMSQILDVSRLDGRRLVLDREDHRPGGAGSRDRRGHADDDESSHPARADPDHAFGAGRSAAAGAGRDEPARQCDKVQPQGRLKSRSSWCSPRPELARLTVTDHGIGIPPERRQHIFERFYQAHEGDHASGMGLGLYISRQIVELHGGSITPSSRHEGGSRFSIDLPTGPADCAPGTARGRTP